jgi:hypothetical protein
MRRIVVVRGPGARAVHPAAAPGARNTRRAGGLPEERRPVGVAGPIVIP